MKRIFIFIMIMAIASTALASFHAVKLTGSSNYWRHFEMKQLSVDVQVLGLFYETTITFEIGFAEDYWEHLPPAGEYEVTWDFNLVENSVITDCWLKPIGETDFVEAEIVDLTTAEEQYQHSPYSQPRQLLRHRWYRRYNGSISKSYQMKYSPMTLTDSPVIKIRYLAPCLPYYNYRRMILPLNEFRVKVEKDITLKIRDQDNPNEKPDLIAGSNSAISWSKEGSYWKAILDDRYFYRQIILGLVPETPDRIYLRTFANEDAQFYQMAILPPITPEDRMPKNIMLAVDVTDQTHNREFIFEKFQEAVQLSSSEYDSIGMVYSSFTPAIYDSSFIPVTAQNINKMFETVECEPAPRLSTLPHLLRQAVQLFNLNKKSGEIWLLSDAYTHSDPPATAMEVINQSLGIADQSITFRIINASYETWPYIWVNGQHYGGNDYLYENLSRLSHGSYLKLREHPGYDFLDTILDCIAPTAATVEIDPEPVNGLCYSRFALNRDRVNFPITLPYYEIGLFDGSSPFQLNFYGMLDGELFVKDVAIDRQQGDIGWQAVATYWYYRYTLDLLLEPQSYETIQYIEEISVQERLLTPYSGFIIPGPGGLCGFQRLSDTTETKVETEPEKAVELPIDFSLHAYPNPFNAATTICFKLPSENFQQDITIRIINSLGQTVRIFKNESYSVSNEVKINWDGSDQKGNPAASGVHFVMIQIGEITKTIKITLLH